MRLWVLACAVVLAGSGAASAQQGGMPPIEIVDVYGLRTVSEDRLRALLPFKDGDPVPSERPPFEEIAAGLGVAQVEGTVVCCGEAGGALVYVGVEEGDSRTPPYRSAPMGDVRLPDDVVAAYAAFTQALIPAIQAGLAGEDRSQGHALSEHPGMRAAQEEFLVYAERDRDLLVEVLEQAADGEQRAIAAHVLGYVADKPAVVDALSAAVFDSHETVRNNATRALAVMAAYASETPDTGIAIDPAPFVALLDSIVWSDRNKGLSLLDSLSRARDPALMAELRAGSIPSLVEMCRWKNWGHAQAACMILQRTLGLPDDAEPSSREATIAAAMAATP